MSQKKTITIPQQITLFQRAPNLELMLAEGNSKRYVARNKQAELPTNRLTNSPATISTLMKRST
jgi:hypothetical protein